MTTGDFRVLQKILKQWDGRRRREELLRLLPIGLLSGLIVGLTAALFSRLRPLLTREELGLFALATALIALSVTSLAVLLRRRSLAEQARFADRQFSLRERMITAIEIHDNRLVVSDKLGGRQLDDAIDAAAAVDTARQMPLNARPAGWLPALSALALLAAIIWLPNPQDAILQEQRTVAEAIGQQIESLTALSDEIGANDTLTAEQRETMQRPLEEALAALQEPSINREEAVAALSQAESELRNLSREYDNAPLNDALAEAASLSGVEAAAGLAQVLQDGQSAQAAADVGALADELAKLDPTTRQALAEQLSAAAAELPVADTELSDSLNRAAESLAAGDDQAAGEALNEAATALNERAQAADQAAAAADQLGAARGEVAQSGTEETVENGGEATAGQGQNGDGDSAGAGNTTAATGAQAGEGGPSAGGGHVESVFVPNPVTLDGDGENVELDVQCLSGSESCGPLGGQTPSESTGETAAGSFVPYDQVFGNYRDAAFEALAGGDIPIGLQGLVRDYFSALEP